LYKTKTTFIIGAGASLELGFPTSDPLKGQISSAVNLGFESHTNHVSRGDKAIAKALMSYSDYRTQDGADEYNKYVRAGWHTAKAMAQAISIDNFIEVQEDEYITKITKLGIASTIIDAEEKCWKYFKKNHTLTKSFGIDSKKTGYIISAKL